jgi:hypothetical protein
MFNAPTEEQALLRAGHGVNPHGMLERTAEGVRREKGA